MPRYLERYAIYKGSVTLDGVSLTVASLGRGTLGVAIIPHTYENTIIHTYRRRDRRSTWRWTLIGKYVEKLLVASR